MSLTEVVLKKPRTVLFQFDGTQAAIDELNELLSDSQAGAEYVDSETYKFTNDINVWPLTSSAGRPASTVLIVSVLADGSVSIFDYQDLADAHVWYDETS